jgi:hypothetical protein
MISFAPLGEMEYTSVDGAGDTTTAQSDSRARRVATPFLQRAANATLPPLPGGWPSQDPNGMGLIGLLVKGMQHRSSLTLTPIPPNVLSHQEPWRGSLNEWQSQVDLTPQESFGGRSVALRRRRRDSESDSDIDSDSAVEFDSRRGRSVRQRALRALLDDVLGGVSDNASGVVLGDDTIDWGNHLE